MVARPLTNAFEEISMENSTAPGDAFCTRMWCMWGGSVEEQSACSASDGQAEAPVPSVQRCSKCNQSYPHFNQLPYNIIKSYN